MKTTETIELFLDGQIEGQELVDFVKEMEQDSNLAAEVRLHQEINESITDDDVHYLRQKLSILIPDIVHRVPYIKVITAVAASIILVLSILTISNQSNIEVFESNYAPYETDLNTRSAESAVSDISYAYLLYQNGEYETALVLLNNYNKEVFNNYSAVFYQGVCALEVGKNSVAEERLQLVANETFTPYALHAKWYLALLYLKLEEPSKAKLVFEELASNDNYYSQRAQKILKKSL